MDQTEKLQRALADAWFALACINPKDLDNVPGNRETFLRARESLNVAGRIIGFPPNFKEFNSVTRELVYEEGYRREGLVPVVKR
jgi:hypothetical protein